MFDTPQAETFNSLTIQFTHRRKVLELKVGFDMRGPVFYRLVREIKNGVAVDEIMRDDEGVNTLFAIERWIESECYPVKPDFIQGLRACTTID